MSKDVDTSDLSKLSDYDLRYAFDRHMITEEQMREHMSEAAQEAIDSEHLGPQLDEDGEPVKKGKQSRSAKAKADDDSDKAPA